MSGLSVLALVGAISALIVLEFRDPAFARSWRHDRPRLRRNICFATASVLVMALLPSLNGQIRERVPPLVVWGDAWLLETIACFMVAELLGWLLHFVKHHNKFFWGFHFQHHRDEQFNIWLSTHTHALEVATSAALIAIATGLLGFSSRVIEVYLVVYSLAKVYQHSALRYTLGPLDALFVGPAYHRLHHEAGSRCNYAISLTLFDVLFGTARWPAQVDAQPELQYGVDKPEDLPFGFWAEMTHVFRNRTDQRTSRQPKAPK
jgi:sterol desaturase/sphingolipid hydroxylase (fatty acid hydroxylase superfamily)